MFVQGLHGIGGFGIFPKTTGKLSGGMKQKLGLCCALIHDPELLILQQGFRLLFG